MSKKLKNIQTFDQHTSELNISDVRQRFIDLLGEDKIKFIEKHNWVEFDRNTMTGTFLMMPERDQIPENINEQLIVELYSK